MLSKAFTRRRDQEANQGLLDASYEDSEKRRKGSRIGRVLWWLQWLVHGVLITLYIAWFVQHNGSRITCELSPEAIGYESLSYYRHSFDNGHGQNFIIREGNGTLGKKRVMYYSDDPKRKEEIDANWKKLYEPVMFMRIDHDEATRLPKRTVKMPDDSGYLSGFDVFHQLHCLDSIRLSFHSDYISTFPNREAFSQHLGHCINYIRQGIMCSADVTPLSFHPNPNLKEPTAEKFVTEFGNPHTCRNFNALFKWTWERRVDVLEYNRKLRITEEEIKKGKIDFEWGPGPE